MTHLLRSTAFLVMALWAVLVSAQTAPAPAPNADYRLGPGDAIRVQVYQNPDLTVEARVSETGTISYPLVGSLSPGGLTIGQAETSIATALRDGRILKRRRSTS